ncbi:MAG: type II toxin-antitoxin system Phd/YefM family antitoxin [Syntrophobacteraceae bacterium]|jgi:prevent-host-death family protein
MEKTINATEAKTHFGELMRRAAEDGQTIIVERSGIPQIAIMPIGEFERMRFASKQKGWEITLLRIRNLKRAIHERLAKGGKELPDIPELINGLREERDGEIADGLR